MAEEYLSTDPNAGLQDEYLSTDPSAGLEKPSGGIVSSVVSEGKRLAGQAAGLLNPIHLLQGALDIQPRSGLQEVMRTGRLLKDIVGGTPVGEAIQKEAPDVYEQQQAILGNRGTEAQRETLRGIGTQLGMVAAPFIHGKVVPLRGKVPTLGEVVNGEAAAPEAMPQTPEPPISEVAAQQTQTIPEAVPKVEEVIPNAEQIQGPARANVDVQLPGWEVAREVYGGEMPADVGGERVPPRGQGETLQQAPQEVAAPVPQPEQPPSLTPEGGEQIPLEGQPKPTEVGQLPQVERPEEGTAEPPPPAAPPPVETAVAPEAPQKASKIGKSIEAKAVEAKLTEGFKDTALYDPISIADQSQRATSFVRDNPTLARAVVRGEAPLPEGLRGTPLITAMEEQLIRKPDAKLAYELANSPLVSETSAAAQEVRLMGERVPDSLAAKFQEIKEARRAGSKLRGETPEALFQDIKKEIVRQSSKRPTWEAFVREITC